MAVEARGAGIFPVASRVCAFLCIVCVGCA